MTTAETNDLMSDVQDYADDWVSSVGHYRTMIDKSFNGTYTADGFSTDLAKLNANFWRDGARIVNATSRALAIAAQRASAP